MKLHFDPNQECQLEVIQSVTSIFEGQPLSKSDFEISFQTHDIFSSIQGVANQISISEEQILKNVRSVQEKNGLSVSDVLNGMHFSIEMETGTGKTYVYLRTIYELNKLYGFKKFVIVVPGIAIREGVLKNLEITHDHLQTLYNKLSVHFEVYDSKSVSSLRNFAISNTVQIMVINIDSFAKDENIINRPNDRLTGQKPIEFIQCTRSLVIVDEPQNMETDIRRKAIESLNYLCTLRYSATHINRYNMVYSLDPVKAYDLGLVKQIEVDSIVTENDFNESYVCIEKVVSTKTFTSAKIKIDVNTKDGVNRKSVNVRIGDDLYEKSNQRDIYKDGYIINGIDRVANYRSCDENGNTLKGKFAQWFEEAYNSISKSSAYNNIIPFSVEKVHNGYFSADRKGHWKDTKGTSQADDDTYKLIMKNKEKLLDSNEPLRFIFSHSALHEGRFPIPDILGYIQERTGLTRGTILEILKQSGRVTDEII